MDIHHATIIHIPPEQVYQALTQPGDLEGWLGSPAVARAEVGAPVEIQYGQRTLKLEITRLQAGRLVQWMVIQPMWPLEGAKQTITWSLSTYEENTLVDFRMDGWPMSDDASTDDVYASVSYKWASFIMRLRIYLGDTRDIANLAGLVINTPAKTKTVSG